MAVVRMLLVGVVLTLMSFGPVAAQNMAETVLRELVQELGPSGAKISKRSQTAVENGVEWRDVVITLPRIQGDWNCRFCGPWRWKTTPWRSLIRTRSQVWQRPCVVCQRYG